MKGNRLMPQCGFSAKVVQILDGIIADYQTVDVLADPAIRDGIKAFSNWPTIPQLYVRGEFVGGCDIVTDLYNSGELHEKLGQTMPERTIPNIAISDAAALRIGEFLARSPGKKLCLTVDTNFQASLGLVPPQGSEIVAVANGLDVIMDIGTASRAEGVSIDLVEGSGGVGFKIDIPSAPRQVKQVTVGEVKRMLENGVRFEFFDVRTVEEREIARIEGARLLDDATAKYIEALPKDTTLVFHCHHGGRSQAAAEHFLRLGFVNVHNMTGGINAWSAEVDPDVPRY
jgi:monothiol glutaredoxin